MICPFFCLVGQNMNGRRKAKLAKLCSVLLTKIQELNLFPLHNFGSGTNRLRAKNLGQWATRLYVVLLILIFAVIITYTFVRPQLLTKTFEQPSWNIYHRLEQDHSATLQCPCSSISSTYDQYVTIKPIFHPVREWMSFFHSNSYY